jgi:hypothetical protein
MRKKVFSRSQACFTKLTKCVQEQNDFIPKAGKKIPRKKSHSERSGGGDGNESVN